MSCRHCTQQPIKNTFTCVPNGEKLSNDVISFIRKWTNTKWKRNEKRRIYFWGGEPLLYWETIKELIRKFYEFDFEFKIYTNGLLLNDEIVSFCNAYNVRVIMSYDAPLSNAVRNVVPSDENIKMFLRIRKRTVNSVFNAINCDLVETFKLLKAKFPATNITVGLINLLWDIPEDIYNFDVNKIADSVQKLKEYAKTDKHSQKWFKKYKDRAYSFDKNDFLEYPFPPCRPGLVSLSVDFNGNVMRCHNDNYVLGHINEDFNSLQQKHLDEWKRLLSPKCYDCECLDICRCTCPIAIKTDDKSEFVQCFYLKEIFKAIMKE